MSENGTTTILCWDRQVSARLPERARTLRAPEPNPPNRPARMRIRCFAWSARMRVICSRSSLGVSPPATVEEREWSETMMYS